jgi:hypothetical protein
MIREIIATIFANVNPNCIISRKIDSSVDTVRAKINSSYIEYRKNIVILVLLNILFLVVSIISNLVVPVKTAGLIIAFFIFLVLLGRSFYFLVRYVKRAIKYRKWFVDFIWLSVNKRSFNKAIKNMLRKIWQNRYANMTNAFTAKLHSIISNIGIVKSAGDIENEVTEKYYCLIREYPIGNIFRKALIIFIVFGVYVFLLQPLVMHFILEMRVIDIIFYPVVIMKGFL